MGLTAIPQHVVFALCGRQWFLVPNHTLRCAQPTTLRERPTYRVTNLTGRGICARAWWLPKANFGKWKNRVKGKRVRFLPEIRNPGKVLARSSFVLERLWHRSFERKSLEVSVSASTLHL